MKSSLGKNTTCGFHNEKLLPDLKPLGKKLFNKKTLFFIIKTSFNFFIFLKKSTLYSEYCNSCKISICYTCGNNHIDKYHDVECN